MKKLSMILGVIVLSLTVNAQNIMLSSGSKGIAKSNDQFSGFQATFSYNEIESVTITGTERGTFSALTIEGAYPAGNIGTPQLPVFKKMIAVPVDAIPKITVKNYTTATYELGAYNIHTLYPVQPAVSKKDTEIPFVYDEKAYGLSEYADYPIAEVEILGQMRGIIIGMMVVRPVYYNPAEHSIMVYNDIEVEVTFENGNYQKTEELYVNTFSPYFKDLYNIVFNKGTSRDLFDDHPDLYKTPVHMLVVADPMFATTLQPWIEWKTQKGFYMDVHYTNESEVGTTATSIKTFCHNKYNQGAGNGTAPTFIVFVGDTPQVPASGLGVAYNGGGSDYHRSTDIYYAEINGNGDYFPEMYYSRLSATNTQQLANQIEKILYYEKYQFADPTYLDNVLLIAGADASWNPTVAQPTINYATNNYYNTDHGYTNIYKYLNSYTNCYTNLNNVGFANYTAHGEEIGWASPSYSVPNVSSLTNVNKYFVAVGNCCLSGDFGYGECLGEAMMRAQQKGAVGYIGSAPLSWWHDDFHFAVGAYQGSWSPTAPTTSNTKEGLYDVSFHDADFNCLSSHVFGANLSVSYAVVTSGYTTDVPALYYWEAYNVLGDGSLMPYNTQGSENTVSHLPVIYIGLPSYEVMATPGSYVAISKDGELLGVAVADASGVANVTLDPLITSGGDVDIVVTRSQYIPYMAQVPAVAQSGPYVVYNSYEVGNDILTYISTNEDINVTLKNVGIETSGALNITISCADPQLTITQATATCPAIAPDGTETVTFKVTVANDIPDNKTFLVDVAVSDGGKNLWESKMPLKAYAPDMKLEKVLINGAENGNLTAGTLTIITTVVTNKGGADAYNVKGELQLESEYITLACEDDKSRAAVNLEAGESINFNFYVITDPNMPYGYETDLGLLITANYGISYNNGFKVSNSGSDNYCVPGNTNCSSYNDRITSIQILKTSDQEVLLNDPTPSCTAGSGYTDYTNVLLEFVPGEQYTIKVKTGYQNHKVKGWIDLNGNNAFDSNEAMFVVTCTSANTEYSANFTIPQDFAPGSQRFRIRTRDGGTEPDACGSYSWGQTLDYTAVLPELYARVQNVEAVLTGTTITTTWEAPAEGTPEGYNIYRDGNRLNSDILTDLTYTEEDITEGVYVYNVTAVYEGNKESFAEMSNVICFFLPPEPEFCEPPVNLSYTVADNAITLTWDEPENIDGELTGYNVYRDEEKINEELVKEKEYIDEELADGTYSYQVSAVYEHCESDLSEGIEVIYVGITDFNAVSYSLYPNPTTGSIILEGKGLNRIEIYDIQGRILIEYNVINEKLQINVNKYDNGIYFVKMYSEANQVVKRLVIMK